MPRKPYLRLALGVLALTAPATLHCQSTSIPRDSEGLRLAQKAEAALIGERQLKDGVLEGQFSARFAAGGEANFSSDIRLEFFDGVYSRVYINFDSPLMPSGAEICTLDSSREIISAWAIGPDRTDSSPTDKDVPLTTVHTLGHGMYANCWSAPTWFFPAMLIKSAIDDEHTAVIYRGHVSKDGLALELLRFYQVSSGNSSGLWQNLTVREAYLDRQTLLPVTIRFWRGGYRESVPLPPEDPLSPANDAIEVRYSDFRKVEGVLVPFSVEWAQPKAMATRLSIKIRTARLNTGLTASHFALSGKIEPEAPPPQESTSGVTERAAALKKALSQLSSKARPEQLRNVQSKAAKWQETKAERDWIDVTDAVYIAAKDSDAKSEVTIATSRGNGATVKYQTLGQRKRNEKPTTAKGLTVAVESMYIGMYHIWSERDGNATSNKDDQFDIAEPKEKVTLQESK